MKLLPEFTDKYQPGLVARLNKIKRSQTVQSENKCTCTPKNITREIRRQIDKKKTKLRSKTIAERTTTNPHFKRSKFDREQIIGMKTN